MGTILYHVLVFFFFNDTATTEIYTTTDTLSLHDALPIKRPLNIRIGLHTGPVFMHYDPVVRRLGFTGAHVNRAARIEPIADHGQVFASEEFAAMSELGAKIAQQSKSKEEDSAGFICEYAGSKRLAKNYP